MSDYVAYHSTEKMGRDFEPSSHFHFYSAKSESFLRGAIGSRVWTVTGTRDDSGHMVYRVAGVFTPSEVRAEGDGYGITGEGTPFRPPIEVTTEPWFSELLREQSNFSFGLNGFSMRARANKRPNKITGANHGQAATVAGEFRRCPRLPVVAQFRR
jgi:hypothetical protein